jgi:hypothetical protein
VCWSAVIVVCCECFCDVSCAATLGVGCVVCCSLVFVFSYASNIVFCVFVFICRLSLLTLFLSLRD